jgi:hypothetical protein
VTHSQSPCRDLNPGSPKYETGVLATLPQCSVTRHKYCSSKSNLKYVTNDSSCYKHCRTILSKLQFSLTDMKLRLATGWTTGQSRFDPRQRQRIFPVACFQTSSGAHPASYLMGTGGPFPGAKGRPGRDAHHSPHLVPRSRMNRSYISSPPKRLHGGEWNSFSF